MAEVAVYGNPTIKRIYGDWTTPNMGTWKPLLLEHAITPIQQYSYTTGKNATDSATIIDAMDVLYSNRVDGFVLVSSDSDFTRLATRLREAGMKSTAWARRRPRALHRGLRQICVHRGHPRRREKARAEAARASQPEPEAVKKPARKSPAAKEGLGAEPAPEPEVKPAEPPEESPKVPKAVVDLIADSLESIADEDGYAFMGELGNLLVKKQPDFDPRNFGFSKLTNLVKSLDRFEVDARQTSAPHVKHIYLRDKQRK